MRKEILAAIRRIFGSMFYLGYIPFASGTVGSFATVAFIWFFKDSVAKYFSLEYAVTFWLVYIGFVAVCIFLSNNAKDTFGRSDPSQIVIDECAGQLITFFLLPITWRVLLLGFVFFRFFDIVKPFPIYKFEEIEDGVGVTMDDVIAGIFANVSLFIVLWAYHAIKSYL